MSFNANTGGLDDGLGLAVQRAEGWPVTERPQYDLRTHFDDMNVTQVLSRARGTELYKAAFQLVVWVTPITVVVGLVGNILSFLVMIQRKNRRVSCCVYMAVLAITDSYSLISYLGFGACLVLNPDHALCRSKTMCKMSGYLMSCSNVSGTMLLVTLTFDRFLAICYPLKARVYCTSKRSWIIAASVVLLCCLYSVPNIFMTGFYKTPNGETCLLLAETSIDLFAKIYSSMNIIIIVIVPFVCLLVLNLRIIMVIRQRHKPFEDEELRRVGGGQDRKRSSVAMSFDVNPRIVVMRSSSSGNVLNDVSKRKDTDRQLTVMLLFVTFAYIILTAPQYTRQLLLLFFDPYSGSVDYALFAFLSVFFQRLFFINYAINFYLYCLVGSKFRRDLCQLLSCSSRSRSSEMTESQVASLPYTSYTDLRFISRQNSVVSNMLSSTSLQNLRFNFVRKLGNNSAISTDRLRTILALKTKQVMLAPPRIVIKKSASTSDLQNIGLSRSHDDIHANTKVGLLLTNERLSSTSHSVSNIYSLVVNSDQNNVVSSEQRQTTSQSFVTLDHVEDETGFAATACPAGNFHKLNVKSYRQIDISPFFTVESGPGQKAKYLSEYLCEDTGRIFITFQNVDQTVEHENVFKGQPSSLESEGGLQQVFTWSEQPEQNFQLYDPCLAEVLHRARSLHNLSQDTATGMQSGGDPCGYLDMSLGSLSNFGMRGGRGSDQSDTFLPGSLSETGSLVSSSSLPQVAFVIESSSPEENFWYF